MHKQDGCDCHRSEHPFRRVVLTGGPGAGKTAALEVARKSLCHHVAVLPEAASIVFGGGFPRRATTASTKAAQRAIYHVQIELERRVEDEGGIAVALCDRGVLDGLAYWPDSYDSFFQDVHATHDGLIRRYDAVIHVRSPGSNEGYNHDNPLRVESAIEAAAIDARLEAIWRKHPRRFVVEPTADFVRKLARTIELIRAEVPECCRGRAAIDVATPPGTTS